MITLVRFMQECVLGGKLQVRMSFAMAIPHPASGFMVTRQPSGGPFAYQLVMPVSGPLHSAHVSVGTSCVNQDSSRGKYVGTSHSFA